MQSLNIENVAVSQIEFSNAHIWNVKYLVIILTVVENVMLVQIL